MPMDIKSIGKQRPTEEQQKKCTINKDILSNENLLNEKESSKIQNPNLLGSQTIYNGLTIVID
jgi:hypothetical protein